MSGLCYSSTGSDLKSHDLPFANPYEGKSLITYQKESEHPLQEKSYNRVFFIILNNRVILFLFT